MKDSALDTTVFPAWAPDWLRDQVESPDCSEGTHPALRRLAKWLCVYMPPDELPGRALYWLRVAADRCDRIPDDAELRRLINWAVSRTGDPASVDYIPQAKVEIDIDYIYELIISGPKRDEYRELSPVRLYDTPRRNTADLLTAWAQTADGPNPWVCHGSKSHFFTRRLDDMRDRAHIFEQITPSPMLEQHGLTAEGKLSEHSLAGTGPRLFLVVEFDFSPVTSSRKPSIWAPLIKACAEAGFSVLDMNAALMAHLRKRGPLWLTVYSGGKSLQSWFPSSDMDDTELERWFRSEARSIGACPSTWTRSQFVRMPDGCRDDGKRQSIEYCNPLILEKTAAADQTAAVSFKSSFGPQRSPTPERKGFL